MKPVNLDNQNNEGPSPVRKQDFLVTAKNTTSKNFKIEKDIFPTKKEYLEGRFSKILSLVILLLAVLSATGFYFFIIQSGTSTKNTPDIAVGNNNFFNNNDIIFKDTYDKKISAKYTSLLPANGIGIYELNSGTPVYEQSADKKYQFASITKLFTIATMQSFMNQDIDIRMDSLGYNILGSKVSIPAGEIVNYNDAIYGMVMASGNDVAVSVARQLGYEDFVKNMNLVAQSMNLTTTSLTSSVGFDDPNNFSTVKDIFSISRFFLRNDINRVAAKTVDYTIKTNVGSYPITNTNELLKLPEVYGLKTGTDDKAGQCLDLYIKIQNREYVAIILGSQDRWKEGTNIVNWLKANG